jgi:lysophospholipid acyltransferase (LPLAT)-like uncharacterized protein
MSAGRRAWYAVLVFLARGVLRFFWATCRVQPVLGVERLDASQRSGEPVLIAYWHQMHLMCSNYLLRRARTGHRLGFLISPSVTGEVPAAIAPRWGAEVIRGSATRSGGQAVRDLYGVVAKQKISPALAVDGPKGPLHECKSGPVLLARMTGAPVLPMAYAASRCIHWRSWDRFIVPLPFSRVVIAVGEPLVVPRSAGLDDLPAYQAQATAAIQAAEERARAALESDQA